jgi:hypothetical protein
MAPRAASHIRDRQAVIRGSMVMKGRRHTTQLAIRSTPPPVSVLTLRIPVDGRNNYSQKKILLTSVKVSK